MRFLAWLTVAALMSGCGDLVFGPEQPGGGDGGTSGTTTGSSFSSSATTTPTSTLSDSTTIADSSSSSGDESSSTSSATVGFIMDPDGGGCLSVRLPNGMTVRCSECDLWTQDCPDGTKCTPWANDGGVFWNATRCAPIADEPDPPGEPCTIEDDPASGLDSCAITGMCWGVDPTSLEGRCVSYCQGSENDPMCPADTACMIANDGALTLCLPTCDPLVADSCVEGESCHPINDTWFCLPDGAGVNDGQLAPAFCEPGSTAVEPARLSSCDAASEVCCTPICDPAAPACVEPLTCSVVGKSTAGVCVDP